MAQAERLNMAEGTQGPGTEGASQVGEGQTGPLQKPWHISPEYDPKRAEEYVVKEEDHYKVFTDPVTDEEVARVLKVEGGVENQPVSEMDLNAEGKSPEYVVEILQTIDVMPAEQREKEENRNFYQQACNVLKEYAHKEKLLYQDPEITIKERELRKRDEGELQKHTPEEQTVLKRLLDNFDATEEEWKRVSNTLGLRMTHEQLFTKKVWEELDATKVRLEGEEQNYKAEIASKTNANFLGSRIDLKKGIEDLVRRQEADKKEEAKEQLKVLQAEPEDWEIELEEELLTEAPVLREPAESLPSFSEVLKYFNHEQQLKNEGSNEFWPEGYNRAKEALSWYLHEAREKRIFSDGLEDTLNQKYQQWANALTPHREFNQFDGSAQVIQKMFPEIQDEIIEFFQNRLDPNKVEYIEHGTRWNSLQRRGVTTADRKRFVGIREELVRRAQIQIEDSLLNLDSNLKMGSLERSYRSGQISTAEYTRQLALIQSHIPINRLPGEWNVRKLEKEIEQGRERQILEAGSEPLFREESYYKISLLGNTRRDIERGADQAADTIIRSATTFSLEVIRERMSLLLRAIEEKTSNLRRTERVSQVDAENMIDQTKRSMTNKLDFYVLDWLAGNLMMDQFSGYLEERMRIDGVEKLRVVPAMNDGLAGLALILLNDPKFRLYFRPQGFKGQLFDDDTTHKYIRGLLEKQIVSLLMQYDLKGETDREKTPHRQALMKATSTDDFLLNFKLSGVLTKKELKNLREEYENTAKEVHTKKDNNEATSQDLDRLREKRMEWVTAQNKFQESESKAKNALNTANHVMNIFGESALLGAPSIVMDNGDYIRVEDAVMFYKYAILQKANEAWKGQGIEDNMALIRYRSKEWIGRWKKAGLDRTKASREFPLRLRDGRIVKFTLQSGFEETGLTVEEWDAFKEAVAKLRKGGHTAEIGGKSFEEILKMDELKPMMNNFLADYKSSESQINNEIVLEEVAKGKLKPIQKVLRRLGLKGREGIKGATTQQRIDNLTQMIEDSRALDAELERLAYFEATHDGLEKKKVPQKDESGNIERDFKGNAIFIKDSKGQDLEVYPFLAKRIDYGFQGMPWGVKRLQHLKAFWYTNLRRTVPRAVDLIHAMPFSLSSLSKEMDFDNILDLCLNIQTSASGLTGMESVDNPSLVMYAQRWKDMVIIRERAEGSVRVAQDGTAKNWGFLEKPLVDANKLWVDMHFDQAQTTKKSLDMALKDPAQIISLESRENLINRLQELILKRLEPIITATEKLLAEDRQALSSGAGHEENEKFALRFLEWLMSEKGKGEEGGDTAREQGGTDAHREIQDIIRLIITPGSYRLADKEKGIESASIWQEVWRKLTPSHNPRLPNSVPPPTYIR